MTITSLNNLFPSGTMTVTKSTAGATTSATISHSDNTNTASTSSIKLSTGGANAGDSFISVTNGVANYSYGLDNTDTDAFVISESTSPGTTNSARCDADGSWTYPSNSAFSVNTNGADAADVTGNDTIYTPHLDTAIFNAGADYDLGTHTYTVPVSGVYLFAGAIALTGGANLYWCIVHFTRNGSFVVEGLQGFDPTANTICANISHIYKYDAGDTATMSLRAGIALKTADFAGNVNNSYFMGALVA